jgi:hypothetical protein
VALTLSKNQCTSEDFRTAEQRFCADHARAIFYDEGMNEETPKHKITQEIGRILANGILRLRPNSEHFSLDLPPAGSVYAETESTSDD